MSELDQAVDHGATAEREAEGLQYPFHPIPENGLAKVIGEGVLWARLPLPFGFDINIYLFDDGDSWTVIDTGLNTSMTRDMWEQLLVNELLGGKPVKRLIVTHTHPDHVGCAGWLVEKTGAEFWMTRTDYLQAKVLKLSASEEVPQEVISFARRAGLPEQAIEMIKAAGNNRFSKAVSDLPGAYRRMEEGMRMRFGQRDWTVTMGYGHAPEHATLMSDDGWFLGGDMLIPRISSNISVYPAECYANPLKDWIISQRRYFGYREDAIVLPSHNEPFTGLRARAAQLIESHARRLHALSKVAETAQTAAAITPQIYRRKLGPMDFMLALGETIAHIHYLEDEGYLVREVREEGDLFRTTKLFEAASHPHFQEVTS